MTDAAKDADRVAVADAMLKSAVVAPADVPEALARIMDNAAVERVKRMGYRVVKLRHETALDWRAAPRPKFVIDAEL